MAKRQVPGGYKEVQVNDTVYWCQQKAQFGSRVKRETRCVTPTQYDQQMKEGQEYADKGRSGELNPPSVGSWESRT